MTYVRLETLTPSQAHALQKLGFILKLVRFLSREWDEYAVYVR